MKKFLQTKRGKSLLLLLLFSVAGLTNAFAQSAYDFTATVSGNTLYFKITDATNHKVEVVAPNITYWGETKPTGSITLPQTVNNGGTDYTITSIGDYAFDDCSGLSGVTFPNSVTTIGSDAFQGCSNLTGITFPSSLTSIGNYAFSGTGITSLNVDGSIGEYAFYNCTSLTTVNIGSNRGTTISYGAFYYCGNVTSLTIGEHLTSINSPYAFSDCHNLENITYNATNCTFGYEGPCAAFTGLGNTCTLTIGAGVTSIPDNAFSGYNGTIGSWGGVTSIGNYAFSNSGFSSFTIPDAITTIGDYVFSNCSNLESVTFGSGLTTTGNSTFSNCTSLTTVVMPSNITTIGEESFLGCTSLNGTGITFGDITTIGQYAFYECTGMTNFTFPSSLTTIGQYAFYGARFTNLTINLASIDDSTFSGITTLTNLTIGRNVTSISDRAFKDCMSLRDVRVLSATPASAGYAMFENTASDLVIYVPAEHLTTYKNAYFWMNYADIMQGWMGTTITGYGSSTESDHWAFIACPYTANTLPTAIDGLIATIPANYDLYRLAPGVASVWENYKAHTEGFVFENGKGYLYASKKDVDIVLTGAMFADAYKDVNLTKGWNLVGNPYGQSAYVDRSYYKMNADGDDIEAVSAYTTTTIPVCTGVVVQAASNSDVARFTYTAPSKASGNGSLQMTLSKVNASGNEVHDKAFVSFDENAQLGKFIFNENHAKLYIPQNGKDYAIAAPQKANEMPVNFKAVQNGEYLLSFETENVEMGYLHLIDNLTGADVDLLVNPSYQFTAKTSDYPSRFRLVFNANGIEEIPVVNDSFAFVSDGQIVVNGEGTLRVIDMQGRQILSREVNSSLLTPNSSLTPGVYVLQLVNGDNVKTQKLIIK